MGTVSVVQADRVTHPWGFTLIELLIVVAIIAILAAVAVPNFLEAQTRSKVARAKNDLRAIATAIESYRVDQTAYPLARTFCTGMSANMEDYNIHPPELTSPIAYLSGPVEDVFNRNHHYKYVAPGRGWSNQVMTILAIWVPKTFPRSGPIADDIPYFESEKSPVRWGLWSVGPTGARTFYESDASHFPVPARTWYDPTNGTVSAGVISRLATGHQSP